MSKKFTFGEPYKHEIYGFLMIKVNGIEAAYLDNGVIDVMDSTPYLEWNHLTQEQLNEEVNRHYQAQITAKAVKKAAKSRIDLTTHWWNVKSVEQKTAICQRLPALLPDILNERIKQYPNNILNNYYYQLITRVKMGRLTIPILSDKDIAKLPRYNDLDDSFEGNDRQMIKLASVVYQPLMRHKNVKKYKL